MTWKIAFDGFAFRGELVAPIIVQRIATKVAVRVEELLQTVIWIKVVPRY